jgi:protocatechuate 3,4-dioxygenase beta subunit
MMTVPHGAAPAQAGTLPADYSVLAKGGRRKARVLVGEAARAQGVVTPLRGRVLDAQGTPVPGAVAEIWR